MTEYHAAERANAALSQFRGMQLTTSQMLELAIAQASLAVAEAGHAKALAHDRHAAAVDRQTAQLVELNRRLGATMPAVDPDPNEEDGELEDASAVEIAKYEAQIEDARTRIEELERGDR